MGLRSYTEQDFREWVERDNRRKDLDRESRQLAAENRLVADELLAELKAEGKTKVSRGGYTAEIETKAGSVSWKDEFLRVAGSAAAAELANAVPSKESVRIREV